MKHTKLLALLLAVVLLFALAACTRDETPKTTANPGKTEEVQTTLATTEEKPQGSFTVVLVTEEETSALEVKLAELEGETLLDLFFTEAYKDRFEADVTQADYTMLNSLKGLVPDAANNEYIAIYTTDKEIADVEGTFTQPVEVDGKTYYGSNFGVADIIPADGESYLFRIASF